MYTINVIQVKSTYLTLCLMCTLYHSQKLGPKLWGFDFSSNLQSSFPPLLQFLSTGLLSLYAGFKPTDLCRLRFFAVRPNWSCLHDGLRVDGGTESKCEIVVLITHIRYTIIIE